MLRIFSCTFWSFVYLLQRNVDLSPSAIFEVGFLLLLLLLLTCRSSLYIQDINSLSVICKCFLAFYRLSFTFLIVSFDVHKLLFVRVWMTPQSPSHSFHLSSFPTIDFLQSSTAIFQKCQRDDIFAAISPAPSLYSYITSSEKPCLPSILKIPSLERLSNSSNITQ